MADYERDSASGTSELSASFEKIAQISHAAREFIRQKFSSSETLQKALREEGANVEIDPFGGVDLCSMSPEEVARFARGYIRTQAKARGEDPDEAEAYGIDWLLANHFNIDMDIAHKLALAHIRGEVSNEEEARKFLAGHQAGS